MLFPGLERALLADGAVPVRWGDDVSAVAWGREMPRTPLGVQTYSCSRELLESHLRQRVRARPTISFIESCEVTALETDDAGSRVVGVQLRPHGAGPHKDIPKRLEATWVVDTSGRSSRAVRWLDELDYPTPEETIIDAQLGYASAYFRLANEPPWKMLIIGSDPPAQTRSSVVAAVEDGRWMVTMTGVGDDQPPTDEEAFLAYAASLPVPGFADMLRAAERLTPIRGFRRTRNHRRHFEKMARWPENFFVLGDAACSVNPVYGQGMTAAALGARALDSCLARRGSEPTVAHRFQRELAQAVDTIWLLATSADHRMPTVESSENDWLARIRHAYIDRLTRSFADRPRAHGAFVRVSHLLDSPATLFHPKILADVFVPGRAGHESSPK